jgi:hypothetical protein
MMADTVTITVGSEQMDFTIEPYKVPPAEWWLLAAVLGVGGIIIIGSAVIYNEVVKKRVS